MSGDLGGSGPFVVVGVRRLAGFLTGPGSKLSLAAAASVMISGLGTVGRYALQVALAQLLGTAGFGLYLTMRRWSEVLSILPNRGYRGTAVRFLPDYATSQKWGLYRCLLRYSLNLTAGGGVAIGSVAAVVGLLVWEDQPGAALLVMATVPVRALFTMVQAILQAQHEYVTSSAVDHLIQPGIMGLALLVAWAALPDLGLDVVMAALLISVLVAASASAVVAWTSTPAEVHQTRGSVATDDERDLGTWRPAARHFFTHQLAATVVGSADLLILAMFVSRSEVGLYGVATRIALLARVISTGTDSIVAPRIAAAWTTRNMASLQRNVDKAIALSTVPTVLLVGALIPLRGPVLGIMGEDFKSAGEVTVILLLGIVVQALTGPCGYVVSLTDNERFDARTMVGAAIFLVVACFIAAPTGGITAVAVVTTTTNVAWNLVLVVFAKRRLGIRCYPYPSMYRSLSLPEWVRTPR